MNTVRIARKTLLALLLLTLAPFAATGRLVAEEPAMFGNTPSRNMVSDEKGLPATWDIKTGLNVIWSEPLGSQSYGGPVVHGGKIFVGTNNEGKPRQHHGLRR